MRFHLSGNSMTSRLRVAALAAAFAMTAPAWAADPVNVRFS